MGAEVSLTPEEVASILKITKNTVYELIKRGELKAYRVGRKIRVDMADVETYKSLGKGNESITAHETIPVAPRFSAQIDPTPRAGLIICGQDVILDILSQHLERHANGSDSLRLNVGSFSGLNALYHDRADIAAIHLWDGDTGEYNIPYVRRLLPGVPSIIIHLACRMQGFYVRKGNPLGIKTWQDLIKKGVGFVNREKGCGTRVLLDEKLRKMGLNPQMISGYEREEISHLAVASVVARGEADVGLGNEKVSLQVRDVDFIPLQKERYELVIKKEALLQPRVQAALEILASNEFKSQVKGLGDYDVTETGRVIAEI